MQAQRRNRKAGCVAAVLLMGVSVWETAGSGKEVTMSMKLTSPAFADGGVIPSKYTCEGMDVSPPLIWAGVPEKTKSLVLIVDDSDAPDPREPKMVWVHWVLYSIPPEAAELAEGVKTKDLPGGAMEGVNDWKMAMAVRPRRSVATATTNSMPWIRCWKG